MLYKSQFLAHSKHTPFPLQKPITEICTGKTLLFIIMIIRKHNCIKRKKFEKPNYVMAENAATIITLRAEKRKT
jgi:hypothetical protein